MTAWTSPRTWVVSEKLFAALLNTHVRDNLLYVKEVLAGTNTDKIANGAFTDNTINGGKLLDNTVLNAKLATGIDGAKLSAGTVTGTQVSSTLTLTGVLNIVSSAFQLAISAGDPFIVFDSGDFLQYDRTNNVLKIQAAASSAWQVNGFGKQGGNGIYDSGEVSVANGATQSFSTAFSNNGGGVAGEGPRFVWGLYGSSSGVNVNQPVAVYQSAGVTCKFTTMTNTTINVNNATGSTQIVRVWAMTN